MVDGLCAESVQVDKSCAVPFLSFVFLSFNCFFFIVKLFLGVNRLVCTAWLFEVLYMILLRSF